MAEKRNNFKSFMEANGEDGVRNIAIEYATTEGYVTFDEIINKYNLTSGAMTSIIRYAFEHALISYQLCLVIKEKAHRNQARHIKDGERRRSPSDVYYDDLLERRMRFIRSTLSERVKTIVQYYINNPGVSLSFIAQHLGYSVEEANVLLRNGIICCIATDEEVEQLIKTSLNKRCSMKQKEGTLRILKEYQEYRNKYSLILQRIQHLQEQIETYDEWASDGDISREDLEEQLKTLKRELQFYEELV